MITAKGLGFLPRKLVLATNRTGGTLSVGGVYAIDVTGSATESTDADSNLSNVVAVADANARGFLVVATAATVDDATGVFTMVGECQALVETTTNDVAEGDSLIAVNAQNYLVKGAGGITPVGDSYYVGCAIALAVTTTNAATLTRVFFDGYALFKCDTTT